MNIEIKGVQGSGQPYETNDYLPRLAETVAASGLPASRVLFSSFSLQNVTAMSRLMPQAKYGMLFAERAEPRAIYADHGDDLSFQYLPFNADYIGRVATIWRDIAAAPLGYLHPEVMTITPETIAAAARQGLGINCWALFEQLTAERIARYRELTAQCASAAVPFTIITDYVSEMLGAYK